MLNRERDRLFGGERGRRRKSGKPEGSDKEPFYHEFLSRVQEGADYVQQNRAHDEDNRQNEACLSANLGCTIAFISLSSGDLYLNDSALQLSVTDHVFSDGFVLIKSIFLDPNFGPPNNDSPNAKMGAFRAIE